MSLWDSLTKYLIDNPDKVFALAKTHLYMSLVPVLVSLLLSIPIGLLAHRIPRLRTAIGIIASIIFTIPSLALFVVLPGLLGTLTLDPINVIVALSLYAVALLVRAVPEALDAVSPTVKDAATAVGYTKLGVILKVELPLAIPVLIANARVVAVTNVSLVSVGSVIGIGGLGTLFTEGYQRSYSSEIVAGIVAILVMALVIDLALVAIGYLLTPWTRATTTARKSRRVGAKPAKAAAA